MSKVDELLDLIGKEMIDAPIAQSEERVLAKLDAIHEEMKLEFSKLALAVAAISVSPAVPVVPTPAPEVPTIPAKPEPEPVAPVKPEPAPVVPVKPEPVIPVPQVPSVDSAFSFLGINIAGADFSTIYPGLHGRDYIWPVEKDFAKYHAEGMKFVRLPFKWERMQRTLFGALESDEVKRLDAALAAAEKFGMIVNLDMHNYFERTEKGVKYQIGSSQVSIAAWLDCWKRLAERYKNHKAVHSFGIMNEPRGTGGKWWPAAQQCITMLNEVAPNKWITACGDGYANAHGFEAKNAGITSIKGKNLIIEVHVYFDGDHKGTYNNRSEIIDPQIGVRRMMDAINFAKKHGFKLFVGEVSAPHNMPTAIAALVNFLDLCKQHNIPVTYWAGGPWWTETAANGIEVKGVFREPISKLRSYRGNMLPFIGPVGSTTAPTQPAAPQPVPEAGFTSVINNYTDATTWLNGIWRTGKSGVSIPNTEANRKAFAEGSSVKFSDGQVRKVTWQQVVGNNISLFVDGNALDGNVVGHPNKIVSV